MHLQSGQTWQIWPNDGGDGVVDGDGSDHDDAHEFDVDVYGYVIGGVLDFEDDGDGCRIKISKTTTHITTTNLQIKHEANKSKLLNTTSMSTFRGINRLSKNIRKSFNDIYSLTKNNSDNYKKNETLKKSTGKVKIWLINKFES